MTVEERDLAELAAELRYEFDGAFATPGIAASSEHESVLAITVGTGRFVLRARELARVEPLRRVVPLPSRSRGLMGLTGIHGRILPVYRLADLLGCASANDERWLALSGFDDGAVALAFSAIDGHAVVERTVLDRTVEGGDRVPAFVRVGGAPRCLVCLADVMATIGSKSEDGTSKE